MVVTSKGIVNGVIEDKYGKHGKHFNENGMPTYSLPLKIEDAPEGTKSFAVVLEDKQAGWKAKQRAFIILWRDGSSRFAAYL